MQIVRDDENDVATIELVNPIRDGEIARDIGPQLTPDGQSLTMSYDAAGFLLGVDIIGASRVLPPPPETGAEIHVVHPDPDCVEFRLGDQPSDEESLVIGPQLTPSGDDIILTYDRQNRLRTIRVEGSSRVLRPLR